MSSSAPPSILEIAIEYSVVRRALIMAVIVGTILVTINHFNCCIVNLKFGDVCLVKAIMTFFVPYAVSTISSVQAIRGQAWKANQASESGSAR